MEKENFDAPEWRKYFEGKSPEEIEEIKKTFKKQKWSRSNTILLLFFLFFSTLIGTCVRTSLREEREAMQKEEREAMQKRARKTELQEKIPVLESKLTKAMKADTEHISDARVDVSVTENGKYQITCNLYFRSSIPNYIITPYCEMLCKKSFSGYPDIDYKSIRIRGYKNGILVGGYTPLGELLK